jgi:Leucine-rich repeat (LRR) protein
MPFVSDDNPEMRALLDGAIDLASEGENAASVTFGDRSHLAGWLVLSDWLDDHDDPRAAFLRARVEDRYTEVPEWVTRHLPEWLGAMPRGARVSISAGIPGLVLTLSPAAKPTPALLAAVAAGWLVLGKCNAPLHLPQFTSVRRLTLEVGTNDAALEALAGSDVEILTIRNGWTITGSGYGSLTRCPQLRRLSVDRGNFLDDAALASLAGCPNLQHLSLTACRSVTGSRLGELSSLRSLHLGATGVRADTLRRSEPMKSLERLVLSSTDYSGAVLASLPAMPALRSLWIHSSNATDGGLVCLERMPALERLDLRGCRQLTGGSLSRLASPARLRLLWFTPHVPRDEALSSGLQPCVGLTELRLSAFPTGFGEAALNFLSGLTELRLLYLAGSDRLTGEFLARLRGATHLESLEIHSPLFDEHFKHLSALTSLRKLNLDGCAAFTGSGLRHLAGLPRLETLSLSQCPALNNERLGALGSLRSLRELNLSGNKTLSDDGLRTLGELPDLVSLQLQNCTALGDLPSLAGMSSLQTLNLGATGISDDALRSLAGMHSLRLLSLYGNDTITDRGIAHLGELTSLQEIQLPTSSKLTDASLETLARLRNLQALSLNFTGTYTLAGVTKLKALRNLRSIVLSQCGLRPEDRDAVRALFPGIHVWIW